MTGVDQSRPDPDVLGVLHDPARRATEDRPRQFTAPEAVRAYNRWKRTHSIDRDAAPSRTRLLEELETTRRQIERKLANRKHAPSELDKRRADANVDQLEKYERSLVERLADAGPLYPRPTTCRKCGAEISDAVSYANSARCGTCLPRTTPTTTGSEHRQ